VSGPKQDLLSDLLEPVSRAAVIGDVERTLGVRRAQAERIVAAFDTFVAQPLEKNLRKLRGRDLVKRNPMIYTVRGVSTVDDWVARVIEDRETSAVESHLGTFLEEVAIIVSGGIKPGSGVDLQVDDTDGVIRLYALQTSPNTKNAGSRKSDVDALKRSAKPLRAARRHVELNIAVLHGRAKTGAVRAEPDVIVLGSDDFWRRVSGTADFRARLLQVSVALAKLLQSRASDEVERIRSEAVELFAADSDGTIDLARLSTAGVFVSPTATALQE